MRKAAKFLDEYPDNFQVSFKWHIKVPLLSSFTPKDTVTLYKYGNNLRSDFTFADFKNMKVIKANMSSFFDGNNSKYYRAYWDNMKMIDVFDKVSDIEKPLLISDLMLGKKLDAKVTMHDHNIKEAERFFGGPVFEELEGYNCQKFEVDLKLSYSTYIKKRVGFKDNLKEDSYFDLSCDLGKVEEMVDNDKIIESSKAVKLLKENNNKEKKIKAYLWIAEGYPMQSRCFLNVIEQLSEGNELISKVKAFLKNEKVQDILNRNGFPLKIEIPYNFVVSVTINFFNFE